MSLLKTPPPLCSSGFVVGVLAAVTATWVRRNYVKASIRNILATLCDDAKDDEDASCTLIISRPASTSLAVEALVRAGEHGLFIVTDFDQTMTTFQSTDCHKAMEGCQKLKASSGYEQQWGQLWAENAQGKWSGGEWWARAHQIIREHGLSRALVDEMVSDGRFKLRPGIKELFRLCHAHGIPVAVVSAGITNVIDAVLRREGIDAYMEHNIVIANEAIWDDDDADHSSASRVARWGPTVHPRNKGHLTSVHAGARAYFARHAHRGHVLCMGDSLSDVDAAKNAYDSRGDAVILTCGFLDHPHDDGTYRWSHLPLSDFTAKYDLLMQRDSSAFGMCRLIRRVCGVDHI